MEAVELLKDCRTQVATNELQHRTQSENGYQATQQMYAKLLREKLERNGCKQRRKAPSIRSEDPHHLDDHHVK